MSSWYAVRCATRRERAALSGLTEVGVTAFLPMETRWGRSHGAMVRHEVQSPLLPGYLFVLIEEAQMRPALDVEGVHAFVDYIDARGDCRPFPIPYGAIIEIQADERSGRYDRRLNFKPPPYRPQKGDAIRVKAGPYLTYIGVVLATPKGQRVHVQLEGSGSPKLKLSHVEAA
jgi:transcription antitermination factor NusG